MPIWRTFDNQHLLSENFHYRPGHLNGMLENSLNLIDGSMRNNLRLQLLKDVVATLEIFLLRKWKHQFEKNAYLTSLVD